MKSQLLSLDKRLNRVHTILTKLTMKTSATLTKREIDAIEKAEELLNAVRDDLHKMARSN